MDKRERIVEAAIEVFCEQGLDAASMADIAARAGVGKGTLYLYFASKDELVEETYRRCREERIRQCRAHADTLPGVLDQLYMRLRDGTRWEMEAPLKNRLVRIYLAHPRFSQNVKVKMVDRCMETMAPLLEKGVASGELRPLPVELLEEIYVRLGSALYYYLEKHPEQAQDEQLWLHMEASLRGCMGAQHQG